MAALILVACAPAKTLRQRAEPTDDFPVTWDGRVGQKTRDARQLQEFRARAVSWRRGGARSELPAEARRERVLAENSFKEKDFDAAIRHYQAALEIYPTWPEGQFNTALLCGEAQRHQEAIRHMNYYLELAPDAPDAQAAKDKITIWQDKIHE